MPRPRKFTGLADAMRLRIATYRPGWALPSIRHLATEFDVSPNTIRKMLAQLVDEGLIQAKGPAVSYVRRPMEAPQPFIRPHSRVGLLLDEYWLQPGNYYCRELVLGLVTSLMDLHVPCTMYSRHAPVQPSIDGFDIGVPPLACAAIVLAGGDGDQALQHLLETGGIVMALDSLARVPGVDSIAVDCEQEASLLVEHLHDRGHRYIGLLSSSIPYAPFHWTDGVDPDVQRFAGAVLATKRRLGLACGRNYHAIAPTRMGDAETGVSIALAQIFRSIPPPTAIICFEAGLAAICEPLLRDRYNLRHPDQILITCRRALGEPSPYPAVAVDAARMGQAAAAHLLNRLCDPRAAACAMTFPGQIQPGSTDQAQ